MRGTRAIAPLALRVRPKAEETAPSLIARLAARHRDRDLEAFCREHGLNLKSLALGHGIDRLVMLARVDGISRPKIDIRSRTVRIGHAVVALGDWSGNGDRYCPFCLRDDTRAAWAAGRQPAVDIHRRPCWDVASVTHCRRHAAALIAACPHCKVGSAWGHIPGECDSCGRSLAAVRPPGRHEEARFSDYATARIAGQPTEVRLLDGLSLKDAAFHAERLGLVITEPLSAQKPRRIAGTAASLREAGFRSLDEWPSVLDGALDRAVAEAREQSAPAGLIGTYGWAYEHWAARLDPGSAFGSAVRTAMRAHALRHGVVALRESALSASPSVRPPGLTGAARRLGWGYERTRREAARRGAIPPGSRRGVGVWITEADVAGIERDHAGMLTVMEASRLLGVGKAQTARIIAAGLLGEPGQGFPMRVHRAACVGLMTELTAGIERLECLPQAAVPLPRACQADGVCLHQACRRILAGEVKVIGFVADGTSLAHLIVEAGILKLPYEDGTLSIVQAASALGLHYEVARFLVRRGLLSTTAGKPGRIDHPGLQRFRTTYMTGVEAAALFAISPKACLQQLGERRVAPVAGPPECRQVIYHRRDVEAAFHINTRPATPCETGSDGPLIERSRRRQGRRGARTEAAPREVQARARLQPVRPARREGRSEDLPGIRSRGRP